MIKKIVRFIFVFLISCVAMANQLFAQTTAGKEIKPPAVILEELNQDGRTQTVFFPTISHPFIITHKGEPYWAKVVGDGTNAILYNDITIHVTNRAITPHFIIYRTNGKDLFLFSEFISGKKCVGVFRVISFSSANSNSTPPEVSKIIGNCSVPTVILNTSNTTLTFDNSTECVFDTTTGKLFECNAKINSTPKRK